MARQSLDSTRPIISGISSKRSSQRFSTYSGASDRTNVTLVNGDPRMADIKDYGDGIERLESKHLQQQRFVPTTEKSDNLNKLALGAKLERALDRRMSGQDAVMRPKRQISEKTELNTSS